MPGPAGAVRRKVFVSYHHKRDQAFYDAFSRMFHSAYETVIDNSLERRMDSNNPDYIIQRIRDEHLTGSSCLIVLCGAGTPKRKFVDWEILAGLNQGMGLVGIGLPGIITDVHGGTDKPARLQDNIDSGYAEWCSWSAVYGNAALLSLIVERTNSKSRSLIRNARSRMPRDVA